MNTSREYFENNFRLVPVVNNEQENNPSHLNEDASESKKEKDSINELFNNNNKGKLILERTPDSSTTSEPNKQEISKIVLEDDTVLKMLLRIQLIILEFLRKVADESDED